MTAAIVWLM
jgi:IS5 family transposase